MIASTDTIIQPLTVMIESINTDLADVAMTTSRQNYDFTCWTYFTHIKLIKQVRERDLRIFLNNTRAEQLEDNATNCPDSEQTADCCLEPPFVSHQIWEHQSLKKELAQEHQ